MVVGTGFVSNIKFFTGQFSRQFLPYHNNSAQTCYTLVSFECQLCDSRKIICNLHKGSWTYTIAMRDGVWILVLNYENNPKWYFAQKVKNNPLSKIVKTKIVTQWILKQSVSYSKMRNGFSWTQNDRPFNLSWTRFSQQ